MLSNEVAVILILIFTCILFLIGVFLFLLFKKFYKRINSQQQEALSNLIEGQENERSRFSRDIHDTLSPELANIKIIIDRISSTNAEDISIVNESKNKIDQIAQKLRNISHDLFPKDLANYYFAEVMEDLLHQPKLEGIQTSFESNCHDKEFPNSIKSHLYSILQELLQNSLKHSNAKNISVDLFTVNDILHFDYEDDGIGLGADNKTKLIDGIGLKNIKTRLELIKGECSIDGQDKFKITIAVKLDKL